MVFGDLSLAIGGRIVTADTRLAYDTPAGRATYISGSGLAGDACYDLRGRTLSHRAVLALATRTNRRGRRVPARVEPPMGRQMDADRSDVCERFSGSVAAPTQAIRRVFARGANSRSAKKMCRLSACSILLPAKRRAFTCAAPASRAFFRASMLSTTIGARKRRARASSQGP